MVFYSSPSDFLAVKQQYQLGFLSTEKPHPDTFNLSQLCREDVRRALKAIQEVDILALQRVSSQLNPLDDICQQIEQVLVAQNNVFIVGCGATGRLALNIERIWREHAPQHADRVRSFMAGGDVALVSSLEGFEDHPEFGAKHLQQMGFQNGDLLIAVTEGGETPYVIGAAEQALKLSDRPTFFMFTNPLEEIAKVE